MPIVVRAGPQQIQLLSIPVASMTSCYKLKKSGVFFTEIGLCEACEDTLRQHTLSFASKALLWMEWLNWTPYEDNTLPCAFA